MRFQGFLTFLVLFVAIVWEGHQFRGMEMERQKLTAEQQQALPHLLRDADALLAHAREVFDLQWSALFNDRTDWARGIVADASDRFLRADRLRQFVAGLAADYEEAREAQAQHERDTFGGVA